MPRPYRRPKGPRRHSADASCLTTNDSGYAPDRAALGRRSPARDKKFPLRGRGGKSKPPCRSDKGDGTGFRTAEPQFHSPVLAGSWNDGEAGDLALPSRMRPRGPGLSCIRGWDYSCGTAPASPPEGALGRTTGLPLFSPAFRRGHLTGFKSQDLRSWRINFGIRHEFHELARILFLLFVTSLQKGLFTAETAEYAEQC